METVFSLLRLVAYTTIGTTFGWSLMAILSLLPAVSWWIAATWAPEANWGPSAATFRSSAAMRDSWGWQEHTLTQIFGVFWPYGSLAGMVIGASVGLVQTAIRYGEGGLTVEWRKNSG